MNLITQILAFIINLLILGVVSFVVIAIGMKVYGALDYPGLILYCLILHIFTLSNR